MTNIQITRTHKIHLGNKISKKCDTGFRHQDPGYVPGDLQNLLNKGEEYIEKNACQRCFAPNTAYGIIQEKANQ